MSEIKITERGWAGHFCCAYKCQFRRNTLLEYGDKAVVVSTVGNMTEIGEEAQEIGHNRYYETCVFRAKYQNGYMDADVTEPLYDYEDGIYADSVVDLFEKYPNVDNDANTMHENVVNAVAIALSGGRI